MSGHKYGLTYPGVGFVVWRDQAELPEDLIFHVNYLGGDMPTFTLNFSRPGNQIVGQLTSEAHPRIEQFLERMKEMLAPYGVLAATPRSRQSASDR